MMVIGADYRPGFQQIAFVDTETGDCGEQHVEHPEEAEKFLSQARDPGKKGAGGHGSQWAWRWFERVLEELNIELWMGDAAVIRAKRPQTQDGSSGCTAHSESPAQG